MPVVSTGAIGGGLGLVSDGAQGACTAFLRTSDWLKQGTRQRRVPETGRVDALCSFTKRSRVTWAFHGEAFLDSRHLR